MEYQGIRDFCGRPAKRLILKSLKPGDRVYRNYSFDYTPGEVTKVTPTGQVTVKYTHGEPDVFLQDGRQRGSSRYSGPHIDMDMTFEERVEWIKAQKRVNAACAALSIIVVGRYADKQSLAAEVKRLQGLLNAARALVEAI